MNEREGPLAKVCDRRTFLRLVAGGVTAAAAGACGPNHSQELIEAKKKIEKAKRIKSTDSTPKSPQATDAINTPTTQPTETPKPEPTETPLPTLNFPEMPEMMSLESIDWKPESFSQNWQRKMESARPGDTLEFSLPQGEILVEKTLELEVKKGVKAIIRGHEDGTRLKLKENLSRLPKEWGSTGHNLLVATVNEGSELEINGVEWHGGSKRAGVGGYEAPPSPWDSIIMVRGKGREGPNPVEGGVGRASVSNCLFYQSEAPGVVLQGLNEAMVINLHGENLDNLATFTWCHNVEIEDCHSHRNLSDGFYLVNCQGANISHSTTDIARQGINLHGCQNTLIEDFQCRQCVEAYTISSSLANSEASKNIDLKDCHSTDCNMAIAFQNCQGVDVENSYHLNAGSWWAHDQNDFLHTGIVGYPPGKAAVYLGSGSDDVSFKNVYVYKSENAPELYFPGNQAEGIEFYGWDNL